MLFSILNIHYEIFLHVEIIYYESKQIMINGEEFITTQARSQRSSAIVLHNHRLIL